MKFKFDVIYCNNTYLKKLYPNLECKSKEETDGIIKDASVLTAQLEQYIDVGEFDVSPIKNNLITT